MYTIIPYSERYRDDAIFCVLAAKDALGKIPRLNEDMLDIGRNYIDQGDMFWLALDSSGRVIGTVGIKAASPTDVWLKRLYVKPSFKRKGVGGAVIRG